MTKDFDVLNMLINVEYKCILLCEHFKCVG
jgi:hypothetical protein